MTQGTTLSRDRGALPLRERGAESPRRRAQASEQGPIQGDAEGVYASDAHGLGTRLAPQKEDLAPTPEVQPEVGQAPPLEFGSEQTLDIRAFIIWAEAEGQRMTASLASLESTESAHPDRESHRADLERHAAALTQSGERLRERAIALMNDSTLLGRPETQPTFPSREEITQLANALRGLEPAGAVMKASTHVCMDAILMLRQGASVMAARELWEAKPEEPKTNASILAKQSDAENPLNQIFKDSGFGNHMSPEKEGGNKTFDWCGMFVGASLFRGGGIDTDIRKGMFHKANVADYFQYRSKSNADRLPKSIWAEGQWHALKDYHTARGSLRTWQTNTQVRKVMESEEGHLDIRPGDVVLIAHDSDNTPNHITMVESYDRSTHQLVTIEGNTRGIRPGADGKVTQAEGGGYVANSGGVDGAGLHIRDMTDVSDASRVRHKELRNTQQAQRAAASSTAHKIKRGATVFGVGRPSVVDFEAHDYARDLVPAEMRSVSPQEMKARAQNKG